ncbi:hypothetical protein Pcinc_030326 [Petrolisthes cinctipes]|uniref:Solute carrier family 13 member 5 n=1 Tax=Petrolisthes cinctipes TaxID=88211 RepID=A0AAE1EZ35_PETCI|nr:hypothetical protein Pcinc_030326 [Petrolisthes cinctipes]
MAAYWVTEAYPSLSQLSSLCSPFPLLGVLSTDEVCIVYMKETNMMFLGGLTVAIAVEHCNLHRRIALRVILSVGQSPRMLMAGFMLTTMFLSMWISNTASTAMMVPIVEAILNELYASQSEKKDDDVIGEDLRVSPTHVSQMELVPTDSGDLQYSSNDLKSEKGDMQIAIHPAFEGKRGKEAEAEAAGQQHKMDEIDNAIQSTSTGLSKTPPNEQCRALRDMCYLATAYAANLGGTGSITGTGPNLVVKGVLASTYSEPTGLNFLTWMLFNVPGMIICVFIAWIWLQIRFLGLFCGKQRRKVVEVSSERKKAIKSLVQMKYNDLGPIRFQELVVLFLFTVLVCLWLFRAPEFIAGWAKLFHDAFGVEVDDATPAILIVFLLFALPAKLDFWCFRKPEDPERDPEDRNSCLTWDVVQKKIPWGVVLLLGGGFAMAEGAQQSGLSSWLGQQLYIFNGVNPGIIVLVVTFFTAMATEITSNSATASIILPVLNELALNINVNPLYLMLPATICCSYAFMLPVATPPNAIVFSTARMKSSEMMNTGIVMNVLCVIVINVMINTLGVAIFDLNTMPAWTNSTRIV